VVGGDEAVEPRAGPDVDDPLAGLDRAQGEGVADSGEGLDGAVGQRVDDRRVVAEPGGEGSSGVEVVGGVGVDGDGAVLLADLSRRTRVSTIGVSVMAGHLVAVVGGWVSYMRMMTTMPDAAVRAATA
jgi:hypothetical protein